MREDDSSDQVVSLRTVAFDLMLAAVISPNLYLHACRRSVQEPIRSKCKAPMH
jgi:hypothetical protein